MVLEFGEIWRKMGNDVLMMDHTVDIRDLVGDVLGKVNVAHSGCSIMMDLHFHVIKDSSEFQTSNGGQSPSQAVSSGHYPSTRVFIEQSLDLIVYSGSHCGIISIEACMYFASETVDIGNFFEVEVFNPILYVLRTSE